MAMKPIELQRHLKKGGVSYMAVTPFKENGDVDYEGYRQNIRWLVDKIKDFENCTLTPCGSNGEFPHLSHEEHKRVMQICVEEVNGAVPVICGTGRASTHETIELSRFAQEIGADGVQVILPYYFVPMEDGMYAHYEKLAEAIDIGIVIYNNPAFSGSWIQPPLMKKMLEGFGANGKIAGVKDNTPHMMSFDGMASVVKQFDVPLYSGFGEKWYMYQYPWGADGLATPFGNFFPEYPRDVFLASQKNDNKKIDELISMMQPYYAFVGRCNAVRKDTGVLYKPGTAIYGEGNFRFGVVKAAMNLMGLHGGIMRLPLTGPTEKETAELKEILKGLGLL